MQVLRIAFISRLLASLCGEFLRQIVSLTVTAMTHILEIVIVYLAVVVGGGFLIRFLTKNYRATLNKLPGCVSSAPKSGLKNAGFYIGCLERTLILTAILVQSSSFAGLILTGKSIARFPELKEKCFAEYFLIGTLLSILLAVLGGILLQQMLYGSIVLR